MAYDVDTMFSRAYNARRVFLFMIGSEMRLSQKFLNGCKTLINMMFAVLTCTCDKTSDDETSDDAQAETSLNQAQTFRLETLRRVNLSSVLVSMCPWLLL